MENIDILDIEFISELLEISMEEAQILLEPLRICDYKQVMELTDLNLKQVKELKKLLEKRV